jgi:hypothetical protein
MENNTDNSNINIGSVPLVSKKAGRKKGSFSFVPLSLAEMGSKIADPNFRFFVSRKQAESLGFEGLTTGSISELNDKFAVQAEENKPQVKVVEL